MTSPAIYERVTVGSVMQRGIECEPQAPLEHVARLMTEESTHSILVSRVPANSPDMRARQLIADVDLMRGLG